MVALWARMAAMFPQWESLYGDVNASAISAWTRNLEGFTEQEIGGAIKSCEHWQDKFPPSYPEFRAACMSARLALKPNITEQRLAQEKAMGKPLNVLEHLSRVANTPLALKEIERMEAILRGDDVETFEQSYHNCGLGKRWPGKISASRS